MPMSCAVADHELRDGVLVTNPEHIEFIRIAIKDFRPRAEICRTCKEAMEFMFERKQRRAILKRKRDRQSQLNSVSSVRSSSSSVSSRNSSTGMIHNDTIDKMVNKTPIHQSQSRNNSLAAERVISQVMVSSADESSILSQTVIPLQDGTKRARFGTTEMEQINTPRLQTYLGGNLNREELLFSPTIYDDEGGRVSGEIEVLTTPHSSRILRTLNTTGNQQISANTVIAAKKVTLSATPIAAKAVQKAKSNVPQPQENSTQTIVASKKPNVTDIRKFTVAIPRVAQPIPPPSTMIRLSQEPSTSTSAANNKDADQQPSSNINIRLSQEPSTSTAATAATPRHQFQRATAVNGKQILSQESTVTDDATEIDDDDDEPRYSLNYFNGTRMPNVQPIIKRSKQSFQHPNPDVMDIYLKGTTGG